jgi:hypothetical protein
MAAMQTNADPTRTGYVLYRALVIHDLVLPPSLSLRRAALKLWKQKLGSGATYIRLIKVFERAGYKDLADVVRSTAGNNFYFTLNSESCITDFI